MINSRNLSDLLPVVEKMAIRFHKRCLIAGYEILTTSTYRDAESQAKLYAQGRTEPGKIVTYANSGQSYHNYKVAFDIVPIRNGKCVWGTSGKDLETWQAIGTIGKACGLEWAGDWKRFREFPHFQYTNGLSIDALKIGIIPK